MATERVDDVVYHCGKLGRDIGTAEIAALRRIYPESAEIAPVKTDRNPLGQAIARLGRLVHILI